MNTELFENQLYRSGLTAQGCWDELDDYAKQAIIRFGLIILKECATLVDEKNHRISLIAGSDLLNHFGVEQ